MAAEIRQCMRKTEHYDILGIGMFSPEQDVKKAYKKLALKFHPDRNHLEGSREVFNKISNSYSVLSNPRLKGEYDERQNYAKNLSERSRILKNKKNKQQFFETNNRSEDSFRKSEENNNNKKSAPKVFDDLAEKIRKEQEKYNLKKKHGGYEEQYMTERKQKIREQMQRKLREEKEKNYNMNKILLICGFLFLFIFFFDPVLTSAPSKNKKTSFSLSQTDVHKYPTKTTKLSNLYFVTRQWMEGQISSARILNIQRLVDARAVDLLVKQCKKERGKSKGKTTGESKGKTTGESKGKTTGESKGKTTDACITLFDMAEKHPDYMQSLLGKQQ